MSGVCAYGGLLHRYCVKCSGRSDNVCSKLCVTCFSFDRTKHEFVTSCRPIISYIIAHHQNENIAICACQLAVEHSTGMRKLFFLLSDVSKLTSPGTRIYFLCVIAADRVIVVGKITLVTVSVSESPRLADVSDEVSDETSPPFVSISILDGPNVCLVTRSGTVYYTWPTATGQSVELFSSHIPTNCHVTSILWCGCDDSATQIVAIGTCMQCSDSTDISSERTRSLVAVALDRDNHEQHTSTTLDATDIVPSMYSATVLCIYIKQLTIESSRTNRGDAEMPHRSEIARDNHTSISASAVVCTSYSQVILFENGRLQKCATLPFNNADKIVTFESSADSAYIAIQSTDNVVCLMLADTFQVLHICTHDSPYMSSGLEIHFFCGSKLLLPSSRPGSKTNFVVANFYASVVLGCVADRITNITQKCIKLTIP